MHLVAVILLISLIIAAFYLSRLEDEVGDIGGGAGGGEMYIENDVTETEAKYIENNITKVE